MSAEAPAAVVAPQAARLKRAPRPGDRAWQHARRRAHDRRRRMALGGGWLALVGLAGLLVWTSSWWQPPAPVGMLIVGAGYQDNLALPPNVLGIRGARQMAATLGDERARSHRYESLISLAGPVVDLWSDTSWESQIAVLRQPTAAVYMCLHGGADAAGPYVLPNDVDVERFEQQALRISAVLHQLAELPTKRRKLLVLDCTQLIDQPSLGMLENDFARQLLALNDQIAAVPNLVVICASGPAQNSWASAELGNTLFNHYWSQGLLGAATDLNQDGRLAVNELFEFVRTSTDRWAQANRATRQTPLLLPEGEEGVRRSARIELAVVRSEGAAPVSATLAETVRLPVGVEQIWRAAEALAAAQPAPWTYTPHRWRRYQELALRRESLLLVNDLPAAERIGERLVELAHEIERARMLELASVGNSLAMPWVAANVGVEPPATSADVARLWNAPAGQLGPQWQAISSGLATPRDRRTLRYFVVQTLVNRATEDPRGSLPRAAEILRALSSPLEPSPSEAQLARFMARDLPLAAAPQELCMLATQALQVRALAQRAAAGMAAPGPTDAGANLAWVAAAVTAADVQRRAGEDRLFADAAHWNDARQALSQAQAGYEAALAAAARGQAAREAVAIAMARLPHYERWVATRVMLGTRQRVGGHRLLDDMESLWQQTHRLETALQAVNKADEQGRPQPIAAETVADLARQADQLNAARGEFEQQVLGQWEALANAASPDGWRDLENCLASPLIPWELRARLLEARARVGRALWVQSGLSAPSSAEIPWEEQRDRTHDVAARRGRLALAALGQAWFDRPAAAGEARRETYEQTLHRLNTFTVDDEGWQSLAAAGRQIGQRYRALAPAIRTAVGAATSATWSGALADLTSADRWLRQLRADTGRDVCRPNLLRALLLQRFLLWQAERTWLDHWWSEDDGEPYYRVAGNLFLADAERLGAPLPSLAEAHAQLQAPGELAWSVPEGQSLTSEPRLEVVGRLTAAPGATVPPGAPTVWAAVHGPLALVAPVADGRMLRQLAGAGSEALLTCTIASPLLAEAEQQLVGEPQRADAALDLFALFRGQRVEAAAPITVAPTPRLTVADLPTPTMANLAVRGGAAPAGPSQGTGRVVFVLDCSGSMGPPAKASFTPQTKYAEAVQALEDVLRDLPAGIEVSIWVFGQALGMEKTTQDPERTIRRAVGPLTWQGPQGNQLGSVASALRYPTIEPWNESPIVEAMLRAKQDLSSTQGFRAMVVITDGMDNRWESHDAGNGPTSVAAALRSGFQGSGITVDVVGFKVVDEEEAAARQQFQTVETLWPAGRYVTVDRAEALASTLSAGLQRRQHYWIESASGRPAHGAPPQGIAVAAPGANNRWLPEGLAPGNYRVRTQRGATSSQDVSLAPGDLLLLELEQRQGRTSFSRVPLAAQDYSWKPRQEAAGWTWAVLQNQRLPAGAAQLLVSAELDQQKQQAWLQQQNPAEVWFALTGDGQSPSSWRWRRIYGYPAASFSLDAAGWPTDDTGVWQKTGLQLWWSSYQPTPPAVALARGADFQHVAELAGRKVYAFDDQVTIEGVAVERHVVETAPGQLQPCDCLVVRLQHAPGKQFRVRVQGVQPLGAEHRYYEPALGRTAALFWNLGTGAEEALTGLSIVSVDALQQSAASRGEAINFSGLPAPQADDVRPTASFSFPSP
ncbi:MAG: hypothetical protein U0836_17050 [Pirellulales bacterium]